VAGMGAAPGGPVVAEDVRDLQSRPDHGRRAMRAARLSQRAAVPGGRVGS
jgi:hypothetical protein